MLNPGVFNLCNFNIAANTPTDGTLSEEITDLQGMLSLAVNLRFAWGSGGGTGAIYLQTSIDQGQTWFDIVCMSFAAAAKHRVYNLSALTPKTDITPVDGALPNDTVLDGLLGDRLRAKLKTTGPIYATSTLLVGRVVAR